MGAPPGRRVSLLLLGMTAALPALIGGLLAWLVHIDHPDVTHGYLGIVLMGALLFYVPLGLAALILAVQTRSAAEIDRRGFKLLGAAWFSVPLSVVHGGFFVLSLALFTTGLYLHRQGLRQARSIPDPVFDSSGPEQGLRVPEPADVLRPAARRKQWRRGVLGIYYCLVFLALAGALASMYKLLTAPVEDAAVFLVGAALCCAFFAGAFMNVGPLAADSHAPIAGAWALVLGLTTLAAVVLAAVVFHFEIAGAWGWLALLGWFLHPLVFMAQPFLLLGLALVGWGMIEQWRALRKAPQPAAPG